MTTPSRSHDAAAAPSAPAEQALSAEDVVDIDLARSIVSTQPFSVFLGAHVIAVGAGTAETELVLRPELLQQFGSAHGGVILYLADNTATFAAATTIGPRLVSSAVSATFLRPATGVALRARATVTGSTRRTAVVHCEVSSVAADGIETLCAIAQVTATVIPDRREP